MGYNNELTRLMRSRGFNNADLIEATGLSPVSIHKSIAGGAMLRKTAGKICEVLAEDPKKIFEIIENGRYKVRNNPISE